MIDVIDLRLGIDQLNQIFDNLDNVLAGQHSDIHGRVEPEFLVYAETSYLAQIITLFGEEKVGDDLAGRSVVRSLRVAQEAVDALNSLTLREGAVLGERVEDNRIVNGAGMLLGEKYSLNPAVENDLDVVLREDSATIQNHLVALL